MARSTPPTQPQQPSPQPASPQHLTHRRSQRAVMIAEKLDHGLEVVHVIGGRVLGSLWITLFESVQDAIALGLLVRIPGWLSLWVLGESFAGLDACWTGNNEWSVARYTCFAVVLSDYTLWAVVIPRIMYRFIRDFRNLGQSGGSHGSRQP